MADSSQDKFLVPKLTAAFSDVQRMEASQFCTFIIHADGKVSACGKGSYGRLELGESSSSCGGEAKQGKTRAEMRRDSSFGGIRAKPPSH